MSSKGNQNSGAESVIPIGSNARTKPKGLIAAISEIEWYNTAEKDGSNINQSFFVLDRKIEFFEVGFKGAFISGLISALLTPLAIGVIEKMIPVFGSTEPTTFDKAFVFLLALGFSLGYAIFIGSVGRFYSGSISKTMIRNFIGGVITGAVLKAIIAFLFFHFIYLIVLKDSNIVSALSFISELYKNPPYESLNKIYYWVVNFKPVFLTSAWFVVATTVIFIFVPLIAIAYNIVREKKIKKGEII
jgi:hypothetical protein